MASCTEETCQDELCTIIQSAKEQDQGRINWISSLNVLSEDEPKPSTNGKQTFDVTDIRQAQIDDSIIGKVYIRSSKVTNDRQPFSEHANRPIRDTTKMGCYGERVAHAIRLYFLGNTTAQS